MPKLYAIQSKRTGCYWSSAFNKWVNAVEEATQYTNPPKTMRTEQVIPIPAN